MPLHLIHGPPNTGRTDLVSAEFLELIHRNPVLVVPGVDDIFTWERRLTRETGALVGGQICHFKDLGTKILEKAGVRLDPLASEIQRRHFAQVAIQKNWPDLADRLDYQPGLVSSTLELIDDFRSNLLDADTLEGRVPNNARLRIRKLPDLYRTYLQDLAESGLSDQPARQMQAAKTDLAAWAAVPFFVAGFDDLTVQQLEVLTRLSRHTDVTIAFTHEIGNPAMALTARMFGELNDAGAEVKTKTARAEGQRDHVHQLLELETNFMRPGGRGKLAPGNAVRVLRSSGKRSEAEAVGAQIARLVDKDVPPGEIAVAIDVPSSEGPLFRDVLDSYGIPVTLESELTASSTATGAAVLALISASGPQGTAADLLRFLRGPAGPDPEEVDRLERLLLRGGAETATEAIKTLRDRGMDAPAGWTPLTKAGDDGTEVARIVGEIALGIGEAILDRDPEPVPGGLTRSETQAATAISRACDELQAIPGLPSRAAILDALGSDAVKIWAVPTEGTTRIASPYSLRAKRVKYLFYVSLQEAGILDADRSGPILTPSDRNDLGLPEYSDPELQARYLFYSALTVPTDGLWLSCRVADETGKSEYPSPLIGAVEDLFADRQVNPEGAESGRSGSELTFTPAAAPSLDEFARSMTIITSDDAVRAAAELEPGQADEILLRRAVALEVEKRTRRLPSLEDPEVLKSISEHRRFSATTVESYAGCPYRWFIDKQLRPLPLGPDPDYFAFGNLLHRTLADLYEGRKGTIPRPGDLPEWVEALGTLIDKHAGELEIGTDSPMHRALRNRARQLITGYLGRESAREAPRFLPEHLERGFGMNGAAAVDMGFWELVGKVDRIDRSIEGGGGIVIDYKTGSSSNLTKTQIERKRRLQLQLYMKAIGESPEISLEPVGGLYMPMGSSDPRPRGVFDAAAGSELADLKVFDNDGCTNFRADLESALGHADEAVKSIIAGELDHDPVTCPDHYDHPAVPDRFNDDEVETTKVTIR